MKFTPDLVFPISVSEPSLGTTLNLEGVTSNNIKDLANALIKNTSITHLNMNNNKLGNIGGEVIADILKNNTTLVEINLSNTQIGDKGANCLAEALDKNTTVCELVLSGNPVDEKSLTEIQKYIERNRKLHHASHATPALESSLERLNKVIDARVDNDSELKEILKGINAPQIETSPSLASSWSSYFYHAIFGSRETPVQTNEPSVRK